MFFLSFLQNVLILSLFGDSVCRMWHISRINKSYPTVWRSGISSIYYFMCGNNNVVLIASFFKIFILSVT